MTLKRICLLIAALTSPILAFPSDKDQVQVVRIVPNRLPDLVVPRSGHNVFYAGGELTVVGGHTTSFVTTQTAEYLADGAWHPMSTAYCHDNGFSVVLPSGEVIIGGGHEDPLGIGQTFMMERYSPLTHTFEGFGCLDRRRVLANATLLADGRVIISGNHYAADAIACYDGRSQVQHVKDAVQGRSNPYILPTATDDAVIVSGNGLYDEHPDTVWVDRLKGEPFRVPLLEQWRPVYTDQPFSSTACSTGGYTYLLTVIDRSGQLAIAEVRDTTFSLLPTACPIPMQGPFGPIFYKGPIVVDSLRRRGYVMGVDSLYHRQYVLSVNYARQPAALTLHYTDSMEHATITIPIVTPDGDLILAGGIAGDNYKPLASVWIYHFATTPQKSGTTVPLWWLWAVLSVVGLAAIAYIIIYLRGKKRRAATVTPIPADLPPTDLPPTGEELMQRICQAIEHDQQYLTQRIRLSGIASELGVSVATLTDCIDRQRHCTFGQLVAEYRVRHAQRLLAEQPDIKLSALITASGFTSESTFFRTFKSVTGLSPKEWQTMQTDAPAQSGAPE